MTQSLADCLGSATTRLKTAGIEEARREARLLLAAHLNRDIGWLIANDDRICAELDAFSETVFAGMIQRRANREPISRILGFREFWSLEFEINADTLDPRPDSETLVEVALAALPATQTGSGTRPQRLLDIGTGSGCLLLALLSERPNAEGVGTDISSGAIACAERNAIRLGLDNRVTFRQTTWADGISGPIDLIISNPPYIPSSVIPGLEPEVERYDPAAALDGGHDGLDAYRAIAAQAPQIASKKAPIVLEFGLGQETSVAEILRDEGYADIMIHKDLTDRPRVLSALISG